VDAEPLQHSGPCSESGASSQACILKSDCHGEGTLAHPVTGFLVYMAPAAPNLSPFGGAEKLLRPVELKPSSLVPPPLEKPPTSVAC